MGVHEQLEAVMSRGAWRSLVPLVSAPADSGDGKEVRRWYRSRRAHWTKEYQRYDYRRSGEADPAGCIRILAVALAPGDKAGTWVAGTRSRWYELPSDPHIVELAVGRGPAWCTEFVESLSQVKLGRNDPWPVGWMGRLTLELVAAGADMPSGPAFPVTWASHYTSLVPPYGTQPVPLASSLTDALRRDPVLPDAFAAALATPRAIGVFENRAAEGFELGRAVVTLVGEGRLDRARVLDDAFAALTRQDDAATQKGIAKLLTALSLGADDIVLRVPLVLGLLATTRGSVTSALLPPTLAAVDALTLLEVAAIILGRPEKAQRTTVLKALLDLGAVGRWGREAVVEALRTAADVPDEAFSNRAKKGLEKLGADDAPASSVEAIPELWVAPPPVAGASVAEPVEPNERGLTEATTRSSTGETPADAALVLDGIVRWFGRDPDGCMGWVRRQVAPDTTDGPMTPYFRSIARHGGHTELDHANTYDDRSASPSSAVDLVLRSEVTARLGSIPYLLSTPTSEDGTLDLGAFVDRLRGYGRIPVGPADLFVALARIGAVDPATTATVDVPSIPMWSPRERPRKLFARRSAPIDAGDVAARWFAAGGLPPLRCHHDEGQVVVAPVESPVPLAQFPGIPEAMFGGRVRDDHRRTYTWSLRSGELGLFPTWVDLVAASLDCEFDQSARPGPEWLPLFVQAPSPGLAVQHLVAATLGHADEDRRLIAVESALVLMGRGRWSIDAYTECCNHLLDEGQLRLARLGHAWEQLILAGGMQPLWPTAMAVVDRAASADRKPAGLSDLLAVLRRYVPSVPEPEVPPAVEALANGRGASKAKVEAGAFVAAARGSSA